MWYWVEFCTFMATILLNMIFLLIRSCLPHEVKLDMVSENKRLPSVDTLEAIRTLISQYITFGTPAPVAIFLLTQSWPEPYNYGYKGLII